MPKLSQYQAIQDINQARPVVKNPGQCMSVYSGDTGFKEIETIGVPSMADEKDLERGLQDIMSILH